jgi:hypothetical protein
VRTQIVHTSIEDHDIEISSQPKSAQSPGQRGTLSGSLSDACPRTRSTSPGHVCTSC